MRWSNAVEILRKSSVSAGGVFVSWLDFFNVSALSSRGCGVVGTVDFGPWESNGDS